MASTGYQSEFRSLLDTVAGDVYFDHDITRLTSFKIGGPVDALVYPKDVEDLVQLLQELSAAAIPYFVAGNLSNVLVSDLGYRGVMIHLKSINSVEVNDDRLIAGAGCRLSKLTTSAIQETLTGAEFYMGIPGTVGGAVVCNSGTLGFETSEILEFVEVLYPDGSMRTLRTNDLEYDFRQSVLKRNSGPIVVSATFRLRKTQDYIVREKTREFMARKRTMQPIHLPSAGCVFIRRTGQRYVNDMLGELRLAGLRVGDAQISEQCPNYIVNRGNATFSDVVEVMSIIRAKVRERFRVELVDEIEIVGPPPPKDG